MLSKVIKNIMIILKRNKFYCLALLVLVGCATPSKYKISEQSGRKIEISVTPDRILLECEKALEDSDEIYGFTIHVLDEANTILPIIQTNGLGKEDCNDRSKKIGDILSDGTDIYIGAIGDLDEPRTKEGKDHFFPKHGTFYGNGRVLQFMAIANEKGMCYQAFRGDEKPCPSGSFPIKKKNP